MMDPLGWLRKNVEVAWAGKEPIKHGARSAFELQETYRGRLVGRRRFPGSPRSRPAPTW
jgi:hypothetical protein